MNLLKGAQPLNLDIDVGAVIDPDTPDIYLNGKKIYRKDR